MKAYITKKRSNPAMIKGVSIKDMEEHVSSSAYVELIWVLLRYQAQLQQIEQSVPAWTGFNYLIEGQTIYKTHTVTYLPAIDQSPTHTETVMELLIQSKMKKAEALGLLETDVVLDQAIYATAVEILQIPINSSLKDFIVLRTGAFHISCLIFMDVIGKRFGDVGLRDYILFDRKTFVWLS